MRKEARLLDVLGVAAAAGLPLVFGAGRHDGVAVTNDEAVVRVLGRGYTGALHGLDALAGAPFGASARSASLACAAGVGLVTYVLARRLLRGRADGPLGVALGVVAAALATSTFAAQRESALVGGSVLGALLVLAPVALASEGAAAPFVALGLGLAATYDVPTGVAAALACGTFALVARKKLAWRAAPFALAGLLPVAWMLLRRRAAPDMALDVPLFAGWLGEGARAAPRGAGLGIARGELGVVALAAAVAGAFVALRARATPAPGAPASTRPLGAALVCVVVVGGVASALGAPSGPARFGAALLAGLGALAVLAAAGMGEVAARVASARVPFARASAAMIVLLELAVPARVADDGALAMAKLAPGAAAEWNARVFGSLPSDAIVFVPTARLALRARAAVATGGLRRDVLVLATTGPSPRALERLLAREPRLSPVVRDLALYGAPEEFSLSELAAARPLYVAFDPRWDKRFARHLLPDGAFDRYFVEPRSASERLRALEQSAPVPALEALVQADPALRDATRDLFAARALAADAAGGRDYAAATTDALRRVAPDDRLGWELARRVRGSGDVSSLGAVGRPTREND